MALIGWTKAQDVVGAVVGGADRNVSTRHGQALEAVDALYSSSLQGLGDSGMFRLFLAHYIRMYHLGGAHIEKIMLQSLQVPTLGQYDSTLSRV